MPTSSLTRKVNTRQTRQVQDPELNSLKEEIKAHIKDIKDKTQLRALFSNPTPDELKIKEFISRAQIVWICATLDYYLHKVQSICIFKVYNKEIQPTSFCHKIKVPLNIVIDLSNGIENAFNELEKVKVQLKEKIEIMSCGNHCYPQKVINWHTICDQINNQIKELKGE